MTQNSIRQLSWQVIAASIIPGIWLTLQQNSRIADDGISLLGTLLATGLLALGLIILALAKNRAIPIWCAPIPGALVWKINDFQSRLSYSERLRLYPFSPTRGAEAQIIEEILHALTSTMSIISQFATPLLMLLVLGWLFRRFRHGMLLLAWANLLLLLLAAVFLTFRFWSFVALGAHADFAYLLPLFVDTLFRSLLLLFVPIVIGGIWVRDTGLRASLAALAFEPIWIESFLAQRIPLWNYIHDNALATTPIGFWFELALSALSYLPLVCFLVILPAGLLYARTKRYQVVWLLLVSLVVISVLNLIPPIVYMGTTRAFSFDQWLELVGVMAVLWLPILFCTLAYNKQGEPQ